MYTHISEWYRIVEPRSDEVMLEKRKKVVEEVISFITDDTGWDSLAACVAGVAGGFIVIGSDSKFTQAIIQSFQTHLLSFPSNLNENALELRVASGITLEEIFNQCANQEDDSCDMAKLAAPLLLSALGLIIPPPEKYLGEKMHQLKLAAENFMEKVAQKLRHREPLDLTSISKSLLPKDEEAWSTFITDFQATLLAIDQQSATDREELEVLWWLQNGMSTRLKRPLISLSPIDAAINAGIEVSKMVILPPLQSTRTVVRQAVEKGRKSASLEAKPLKIWANKGEIKTWGQLATTDDTIYGFVGSYPSLFPLSWLGMRLHESRGTADWENEFEQRTGVSSEQIFTPPDISEQVFCEQVAIRTYQSLS